MSMQMPFLQCGVEGLFHYIFMLSLFDTVVKKIYCTALV